jgi:ketosteroid isomerase-like protein
MVGGNSLLGSQQAVKLKTWAVVVATLAVCTCDIAVAVDKHDPAASKVLALEKEWNEVYKRADVQTMNTLFADDYIITVEDGSTFSKAGYIAHNGNSTVHVDISEMSDLKVRMHGDTAIVTGAYYEKGTENGKPYEYHDRLTDVWMNAKGGWKLIASHYSLRSQ